MNSVTTSHLKIIAPDLGFNAYRTGLATFGFFSLFAGDFWRNLLGWPGYIVLTLTFTTLCLIVYTKYPAINSRTPIPKSLSAFLILITVSVAWSAYPGATSLGILSQFMATFIAFFFVRYLTLEELITSLGKSLRWIIGLSVLFEAFVATVLRTPILPFWTTPPDVDPIPGPFFWSANLLLNGGPIQGIVGNRNLLAFVAALCLIISILEILHKQSLRLGIWIGLCIATLLLTRSATIFFILVATTAMSALVIWCRSLHEHKRLALYIAALIGTFATIIVFFLWSDIIFSFLGKSPDMTGRSDIWRSVIDLASQRPILGWGWVSYWAPWTEPLGSLVERHGVTYLQAHNAWLDIWMQIGYVGLIFFSTMALITAWKAWFFAVDKRQVHLRSPKPYTTTTLFPILMLTALLTHTISESRILVEGGWVLFIALVLWMKKETYD